MNGTGVAEESCYALIGNIPHDYHSSDLRNYFSQFIESGGFSCFHFRHRPEVKVNIKDGIKTDSLSKQSSTSSQSSSKYHTQSANPKTCCVVKMTPTKREEFIKMYDRKHWLDRNGDSIPPVCLIEKIKTASNASGCNPYKTRQEQKAIPPDREEFTQEDLNKLAELHPPDVMPNGNVGTTTKTFLEFIRTCRLPPIVIKKLGLTFPKTRSNKKYGNVPFDYGGVLEPGDGEEQTVISGTGHELENENMHIMEGIQKKKDQLAREIEAKAEGHANNEVNDSDSGDDNDTCEEWERHEALYDDPTNQERNKERLYEEEIELKWEKGGSGLVFYTDAQYWQEKEEGDFDEQTADDWDVDMSVYYEADGGDKDAKDYVQMRREKRLRDGLEQETVFKKKKTWENHNGLKIGKFEKHTKGAGRKIMVQQGWREGQALGTEWNPGIADALDNEGQHPSDKSGFGYRGEKINTYTGATKHGRDQDVIISTIYDNPMETDPVEPLLRRSDPYHITYRQEFKKASENK